jgi:excisionase family DNA binding protein
MAELRCSECGQIVEIGGRSLDVSRGLTPTELAQLMRVSADRIRTWIRNGDLKAVNTAKVRCGKPRFVVLPWQLEEFVRGRAAAEPPTPFRKKRREPDIEDYFPDI